MEMGTLADKLNTLQNCCLQSSRLQSEVWQTW